MIRIRIESIHPLVGSAMTCVAIFATSLFFHGQTTAQQPLPAEGSEAQLLDRLKGDAELFEKAKACQRLAIIGTADSVPVLASLLGDEQLDHYARLGLEANPSPLVDQAFRDALGSLSGKPLIGVINSVGVRQDSEAVDVLAPLTQSDNAEVAAAALAALGAIASPSAIEKIKPALEGDEALRIVAADACLTAADVLLRRGDSAQAASVLAAVRMANLPRHIHIASRFGELRASDEKTNQSMMEYLAAEDNDLFRIGLELAHVVPGAEVTQALLDLMDTMPADRKVLLVNVLGSRGDSAARPAVMELAASDNPDLQIAAIEVLGTLGDATVVPMLLDAAAEDSASLAQAARDSLVELSDEKVNSVLMEALKNRDGAARLAAVDAVGRRGATAAIPKLLEFMEADNVELQKASIDALSLTIGAKELPQILDRLVSAESAETATSLRNALQKACQRMPDRDAAATVLFSRMQEAPASTKAELLDLLIYVGGDKALKGIATAAAGNDDALADAATQALGKWLTPDVAPVLIDLAQNGNANYRVRCLRGYIRVIRQFGLRPGERLQMCKTAFDSATRDDERKLVLDTLTRFPSTAGLQMAVKHLDNSALQEEASKAAIAICEKIVNTDRKAVATAMPMVLETIRDPQWTDRAKVVVAQAQQ
jgi:HEAT repeat protein